MVLVTMGGIEPHSPSQTILPLPKTCTLSFPRYPQGSDHHRIVLPVRFHPTWCMRATPLWAAGWHAGETYQAGVPTFTQQTALPGDSLCAAFIENELGSFEIEEDRSARRVDSGLVRLLGSRQGEKVNGQ
jgi:hypothetical protein